MLSLSEYSIQKCCVIASKVDSENYPISYAIITSLTTLEAIFMLTMDVGYGYSHFCGRIIPFF